MPTRGQARAKGKEDRPNDFFEAKTDRKSGILPKEDMSKLFEGVHNSFPDVSYISGRVGMSGSLSGGSTAIVMWLLIQAMMELSGVTEVEELKGIFNIFDLGCGDGRFMLMAALSDYFGYAFGIDLEEHSENIINIFESALTKMKRDYCPVIFAWGDLFLKADLLDFIADHFKELVSGRSNCAYSFCESINFEVKVHMLIMAYKYFDIIFLADKMTELKRLIRELKLNTGNGPFVVKSLHKNLKFFRSKESTSGVLLIKNRSYNRVDLTLSSDDSLVESASRQSEDSPVFLREERDGDELSGIDPGSAASSPGSDPEDSTGQCELKPDRFFGVDEGEVDEHSVLDNSEVSGINPGSNISSSGSDPDDSTGQCELKIDRFLSGGSDVDEPVEPSVELLESSVEVEVEEDEITKIIHPDIDRKEHKTIEEIVGILRENTDGLCLRSISPGMGRVFIFMGAASGKSFYLEVRETIGTGYNEPTYRSACVIQEFRDVRADNNPFPKPVNVLKDGKRMTWFAVYRKGAGAFYTFMALEEMKDFMNDLIGSVKKEFNDTGRVSFEWQDTVKRIMNAMCFLHAREVAHVNLCPSNIMVTLNGRLVLVGNYNIQFIRKYNYFIVPSQMLDNSGKSGFGTMNYPALKMPEVGSDVCIITHNPLGILGAPGFQLDIGVVLDRSGSCFKWDRVWKDNGCAKMADSFAMGHILLLPFLPDEEMKERNAFLCSIPSPQEDNMWTCKPVNTLEKIKSGCGENARDVVDIALAFVGGKMPSFNKGALSSEIRAERVLGLASLAESIISGMCSVDAKIPPTNDQSVQNAFSSSFVTQYIPHSLDLEERLISGIVIEGQHGLKRVVLFLLPVWGLTTFSLEEIPKGAGVCMYGCLYESRTGRDHVKSIDMFNNHVTPLDTGGQLNGDPSNSKFPLERMIEHCCVGSCMASSRAHPLDTETAGNVTLEQKKNTVKNVDVGGGLTISMICMFAAKDIEAGKLLKWNYPWGIGCGGSPYTENQVTSMMEYYNSVDVEELDHVKAQVREKRR